MFTKGSPLVFKENSEKKDLKGSWRVLIVDDEEEVHTISKAVLKNFVFKEKNLEILHAYSGREAVEILKNESDIALVLLDVVMEEDDSGLKVVKIIREELKNIFVRIILRTGQPGIAPEEEVIKDYDINDYKEKTELTSKKLTTTIVSSLRAYEDLMIIERNRLGLSHIIKSTKKLFQVKSLQQFSYGVLIQLSSLLRSDADAFCIHISSKQNRKYSFISGIGKYEKIEDEHDCNIEPEIIKNIETVIEQGKSAFINNTFIGYFKMKNSVEHILYVNNCHNLEEEDKELIDIFSTNIASAFENIYFEKNIIETQAELLYLLGNIKIDEHKNIKEHISKVSELIYEFALKAGICSDEARKIKFASCLHDVGMVSLPKMILNKTTPLSKEEFELIKTHTTVSYYMFQKSENEILKLASQISHEHHERYDGDGYPNGLKGEEIHLYSRLLTIVDTFEAMLEDKPYRKAKDLKDIYDYIDSQKGRHFDPNLANIFLANFDEMVRVSKNIDAKI